jgi:hypothetical protein
MKKLLGLIIIMTIALCANQSNLKAETAGTGSHTRWVTAYWCDYGMGDCLRFKGNGDIFLVIPGILKTIRVQVPTNNIVPTLDNGVSEYHDFFLYTDTPNMLTGKGYKNGLLRYTDQNYFEVYEVDDQVEFTNYSSWYQAVQ